MMFRRSGSFGCYLIEGTVPPPPGPAFLEALASRRFSSIEASVSEESSVGWVTPGDPTGESFEAEDIDYDAGFWLRMRIDKKALPTKWITIYRAAAEKSRGRPLTRRERQELTTDLKEKLLPRVLPTVNLVDVLFAPQGDRLLLFATGTGVRDAFSTLFHQSFNGAHLLPADPHYLARNSGLDPAQVAYLDEAAAVRWPRDGKPLQTAATRPEPEHPEPAPPPATDTQTELEAEQAL